jgi:hypothetical protein
VSLVSRSFVHSPITIQTEVEGRLKSYTFNLNLVRTAIWTSKRLLVTRHYRFLLFLLVEVAGFPVRESDYLLGLGVDDLTATVTV